MPFDESLIIRIQDTQAKMEAKQLAMGLERVKLATVKANAGLVKTNAIVKETGLGFVGAANKMNRMTYGLRSLGRELTMMSLPIAYMAYHATKTSVEYDHAMNRIQAITGSTAKQVNSLRRQTIALGQTTIYTPGELAAGLVDASKYYKKIGDLQKYIGLTAKFGYANQEKFKDASDSALKMISAYHLNLQGLKRDYDLITYAGTKANTSSSQLASGYAYAGDKAYALGVAQAEVISGLAVLSREGVTGMKAGREFGMMLQGLATPNAAVSKWFSTRHIKIRDGLGHMRSMVDIYSQLRALKLKDPASSFKFIFGKEYAEKAALAIYNNDKLFNSMVAGADKSYGAMDRIGKTMNDTQTALMHVRASWSAFEDSVVDKSVLHELTGISDRFAGILNHLSKASPAAKHFLGWMTLVAGLAGPMLNLAVKLFMIGYFLKELEMGGMIVAALTDPFVLLAAAVVAVILLRKKIEYLFKEFATGKEYVDMIRASVDLLTDSFKGAARGIEFLIKKYKELSRDKQQQLSATVYRIIAGGVPGAVPLMHLLAPALSAVDRAMQRRHTAAITGANAGGAYTIGAMTGKPPSGQQSVKTYLHLSIDDPGKLITHVGTTSDAGAHETTIGRSMAMPSI